VVYEIIPQSHRAHGGRTDGDYYLSRKQLVGFSRMDGMKIKNVDRLCELCDSVVNNRIYLIKRSSNHRAMVES